MLASKAALSVRERQLSLSNIPLLMHQTGASSKVDTWKPEIIPWVQQWLGYAASPNNTAPMAYFFWDDEGIDLFMERYEKDFIHDFYNIFTPVERADIFRVLVCQHFGGVVCLSYSPYFPYLSALSNQSK